MSDFVVDVSAWRMRDFIEFEKSVKTGDYDAMFSRFAAIVKSWPFEYDPSKQESYGDLRITEFKQLQVAVTKSLSAAFSE